MSHLCACRARHLDAMVCAVERSELVTPQDPVSLLESVFLHAPVAFQIYGSDGHCLLTNHAFRRLFGVAPPPEYNVLHDRIVERNGHRELIRRAFAGETISVPPLW